MEIHDSDPTAQEPADPWDRTTSQFSLLSEQLKAAYRKAADDAGPSEGEVKDAFATLLGAWDQVADSVTSALRDPETREQLKKVASSFAAAIGTTIADLGAEFSDRRTGNSEEE
ncbi:MAG: hypothetical protein OEM39_00510 [Acidimicrobiia bacterium]|nr:hypothetical protein [Acidimicrobiia bacterium]MDH3462587.1 hypothetical protein [Acidimicrobiia bacterium]